MSGPFAVLLLALAVLGLLIPQLRSWNWCPAVACAIVAVASGTSSLHTSYEAIRPLFGPVAFVALAVPMAVMLDRYGVFIELARMISTGRGYRGVLWILAAVVTAVLNLDAAVVMLTPLYIRIAEERRESPLALALQAALLSALASSALPVSNLTNLIAAARDGASVTAFLIHLGPPTVVATTVGWLAYRWGYARITRLDRSTPRLEGEPHSRGPDRPASVTLVVGGLLVLAVVAGFVLLPAVGGAPYEVAAAADVVLVLLTRSFPWRDVPVSSVAMVLALGVLAGVAAGVLGVDRLIGGSSPLDLVRTTAATAAGSNVVNNLPALLVALPATGRTPSWSLWAVLLGTNVGALILPSASLALLLWSSTARRLGLPVRDGDLVRIGWWICLPALVGATGMLVLMRIVLGASGY